MDKKDIIMGRMNRRTRAKKQQAERAEQARMATLSLMAESDTPIESGATDFVPNGRRRVKMQNFKSFEQVNARDIRVCGREHIGAYLRLQWDSVPFPAIESRQY